MKKKVVLALLLSISLCTGVVGCGSETGSRHEEKDNIKDSELAKLITEELSKRDEKMSEVDDVMSSMIESVSPEEQGTGIVPDVEEPVDKSEDVITLDMIQGKAFSADILVLRVYPNTTTKYSGRITYSDDYRYHFVGNYRFSYNRSDDITEMPVEEYGYVGVGGVIRLGSNDFAHSLSGFFLKDIIDGTAQVSNVPEDSYDFFDVYSTCRKSADFSDGELWVDYVTDYVSLSIRFSNLSYETGGTEMPEDFAYFLENDCDNLTDWDMEDGPSYPYYEDESNVIELTPDTLIPSTSVEE